MIDPLLGEKDWLFFDQQLKGSFYLKILSISLLRKNLSKIHNFSLVFSVSILESTMEHKNLTPKETILKGHWELEIAIGLYVS